MKLGMLDVYEYGTNGGTVSYLHTRAEDKLEVRALDGGNRGVIALSVERMTDDTEGNGYRIERIAQFYTVEQMRQIVSEADAAIAAATAPEKPASWVAERAAAQEREGVR